jgi:hypothetical protein
LNTLQLFPQRFGRLLNLRSAHPTRHSAEQRNGRKQALILMGDWCVPAACNRTNEDPGRVPKERRTHERRRRPFKKKKLLAGALRAMTRGA